METSTDTYSSSEAEHDHHAFRYLPQSNVLILPTVINDYDGEDSFDGFLIFRVKPDEISYMYNVSMAKSREIWGGCWSQASMPSRVLVFQGNATFMKRHTYQSWDLDKETMRWNNRLDGNRTESSQVRCFNYFMPRAQRMS